jgi:hypothetical protein
MSKLSLSAILWLILGQPAIVVVGAMLWTFGYFLYIATLLSVGAASTSAHATKETLGVMAAYALAIVGIFTISRIFSWIVTSSVAGCFLRLKSKVSFWELFALTPICAFLLWFGYDRLIPDYRFMNDARPPYEHGLTWSRFGVAWAIEIAVMFAYWFPLRKVRADQLMSKPDDVIQESEAKVSGDSAHDL